MRVYVTGCDRGLGRSLANEFASHGHTVFAGLHHFEATLRDLPFASDLATPIALDVNDDASVARAASEIARRVDSLDMLINNAARLGVGGPSIGDAIDYADLLATYDTNALGPLRVANSVIELLRAGKRKLIANISSEAGSIGMTGRQSEFGYCMSKAALNMQTAIAHNKLKGEGFLVRAIQPGWMKTYMTGKRMEEATLEPDAVARDIYALLAKEEAIPSHAPFTDWLGEPLPW